MTLSRRQARRQALFLLYQWDLSAQPIGSQYDGEIDPWAREVAEAVAAALSDWGTETGPIEVAVCSTGLIGDRLPMDKVLAGVTEIVHELGGGLTGGEVGIAGGSAILAQRILEAIFGDQAVRSLAAQARRKLMHRAQELYDDERSRLDAAILAVEGSAGQSDRIKAAAAAVEAAR